MVNSTDKKAGEEWGNPEPVEPIDNTWPPREFSINPYLANLREGKRRARALREQGRQGLSDGNGNGKGPLGETQVIAAPENIPVATTVEGPKQPGEGRV